MIGLVQRTAIRKGCPLKFYEQPAKPFKFDISPKKMFICFAQKHKSGFNDLMARLEQAYGNADDKQLPAGAVICPQGVFLRHSFSMFALLPSSENCSLFCILAYYSAQQLGKKLMELAMLGISLTRG